VTELLAALQESQAKFEHHDVPPRIHVDGDRQVPDAAVNDGTYTG
jgi:hypothetical protein